MIPPDVIAQVRDRTNIVAVVQESVPSLKRRGRSFVGLCPFHQEKTPSFHVNPDRGFFHCFGCKESGSVIDFLMKQDGYTFPEAVRALAERAGIVIEERDYDPVERDAAARQKKQKDDLYAVNALAATYWEEQLRTHPMRKYALDELARRGLVAGASTEIDDALQAFRIGYAPPGWDGLATFVKAQGVSPVAAESVGLLVPRSSGSGHYDRFRHRLMFAVIDPQGRVIAFSGRALADIPDESPNAEKRDPPAKYINSPESPIYTKGAALFGLYQARHAIRAEDLAVLVEGNFDVVSLHARGLQNVVAPLGTAFTVDQAKLLRRFASSVTILFDGDRAGHKATRLAREPCRQAQLRARVATLPEGQDPDDFARTRGTEALAQVLSQARGMLDHLIEEALDESFAAADVHDRVARVEYVAKLLNDENDALVRATLKTRVDYLAGRLDLHGLSMRRDDAAHSEPFRALIDKVRKDAASSAPRPPQGADPRRARIQPRPAGTEQRKAMIGALIEFPELLDDPEVQAFLDQFEGVSAQVVAGLAKARILAKDAGAAVEGPPPDGGPTTPQEKTINASVFLAQIPEAIHPFAFERLAAPEHDTVDLARESFLNNGSKLRSVMLERETIEIAREQQKVLGDDEAEMRLARDAEERQRQRQGIK